MTVEFFGVRGFGPIGPNGKISRPGEAQKSNKAGGTEEASFSSALQGAHETKSASATGETGRSARVQELKEQVANGSYEPDLNKVASSLLKFLVEEG
ncbi:MAG TPA: flagellar biosynthesis anti-sigma factor FlgM [Desulfobulbaceae bacterium]|nr:flagellar biosynthesis anti-sigma factor FlgM [Desulfobulbaceae bacterium]